MLELFDGMTLYHGSTVPVEQPDLAMCSPRKDFGRGFYLTSSAEQARDFARIVSRRRARERDEEPALDSGFVSSFRLTHVDGLDIRVFETANADWLHCIVAHRQGHPFEQLALDLAKTDIITGKVANDQTNATILAYLAGAYGEMGSPSADEICVGLLLPDRLKDQACFRTQQALDSLEYLGSERV